MRIATALGQAADAVLHLVAPGTARARTEQPDFTLERTEGAVELRRYAPMVVAEIEGTGTRDETQDDLFGPLAGYIFASERDGPEIAMTTPVTQAPKGPAADPNAAGRYALRFMMPDKWTLEDLPAPADPRIRLERVPARRLAVLPFKGRADDAAVADASDRLRDGIRAAGLTPVGGIGFSYYDPPWTPAPARLNEVWQEVEG